jgi:polysaccharide export outer membrane protein
MHRVILVVCAIALLTGCQTTGSNEILSPEEFLRRTKGPETSAATDSGPAMRIMGSSVETDSSATNQADVTFAQSKLIRPGVVLTIVVAEDASLNRQYVVPPTGQIDYPPLGRLAVEGLTAEELADKLRAALEKDYFRKATVQASVETTPVKSGTGGVIYILGNINRPGPMLLPPNENFTVAKAIIAAGNVSTFGNASKIKLIRYLEDGTKLQTIVNVDRILKRGEFEKDNIQLQHGDWLIVPEKIFNF